MDFLPDISITLIIGIILFLTVIGFYMWGVVTRRIISSIEKYRNRLDRILTITKDLREELYGDILLNKIMDYSISITQSDAGSILLAEDNDLAVRVVRGGKGDELIGMTIPKGKGIAGWVAEKGQPVRLSDVKGDERFNPEVDEITGYQTKSVLCVPLTMKTGVSVSWNC
jgi:GAF domain-containing protein